MQLSSPYVSDLILKGEIGAIKEAMKHSTKIGVQTFDESLLRLFAAGQITYQDAIEELPPEKEEARGGRIGG